MKRKTTLQTEAINKQRSAAKLYEHKRDVTVNTGCIIDALRKRAREHDVDKARGNTKHHFTARHHFLAHAPEKMNVIDFAEAMADCVARGHEHGNHIIVPVSSKIGEDSVFIDFIYNSIWEAVRARYPQAQPEDWLIEVSVSSEND